MSKFSEKQKPKGVGNIILAPALVVLSMLFFGEENRSGAFLGMGFYGLTVFMVISFLWCEIGAILSSKKMKVQKAILLLASILAVFATPLMIVIVLFQYLYLYILQFSLGEKCIVREYAKSDIIQYYLLSVGSLLVGSFFFFRFIGSGSS